jgi:hypothetical protein
VIFAEKPKISLSTFHPTNKGEWKMSTSDFGVITLAYGLPKYIEMAKTLARSLRLHSPNISRAIVTDCPDDKELSELFDHVILLNNEYGSNLRQKLYLNQYSPYKRTVFIDSDCIAVRDIQFIFEALEERSFTVVGDNYLKVGDKDLYVDMDSVFKNFGFDKIPKFNGGIYYFDKSQTANAVFQTAADILLDWKELGLTEFRGDGPNEEPIFALAMTVHKQTLFEDEGQIMRTPIGIRGLLDIDVFTGKSTFKKKNKVVSPAIVHFACVWNEHPVYYRESLKLRMPSETKFHENNLRIYSAIKHHFGYQIAFARYVSQRVPKTPKYGKTMLRRMLKFI